MEEERCRMEQNRAQRRAYRARMEMLAAYSFEGGVRYASLNMAVPLLRRYFAGEDTRPNFRLSKASITSLLQLLNQERCHGWGPTIEVLVLLFWLASGASYRVVSRAFDMPRTTVHNVVHRVCGCVVVAMPRVIRLPSTAEGQREVSEGFARLARHGAFARAMGAIDSCHVRIKSPGEPHGQDYFNRKLFHSIQLQAVCDHAGRFIDVFVGYPGSVHDTRVLRHSPLFQSAAYPPPDTFLLGDGGYPCLLRPISLITPYKNPLRGVAQQRFNAHHARARSVIERAFGMMKTRWRSIFFCALEVDVSFVPDVIVCCTMLHNVCLGNDDVLPVDEEDPEEPVGGEDHGKTSSGGALRDSIADQLSALQCLPLDMIIVDKL
ncbi:putative nuclease HARBI1 isoform X3 [Hypomesus transpacificus]|nr:putative nuclease HARBI1 isoform X3 [Hypomesus transpacificus]